MAYIENGTWEIYQDVSSVTRDMEDFFEVDELIAPTIAILNKKNYKTAFCCSGHIFKSLVGLTVTAGFKGEIEGIKIDSNEGDDDIEIDMVQDISDVYICFEKIHDFESLPSGFYYDDYDEGTVIRRELEEGEGSIERAEELLKVAKELKAWAEGLAPII